MTKQEKIDACYQHACLMYGKEVLDKVQKGKADMLSEGAIQMLKKAKLIEGRKPHLYISKQIARVTDQKVEYSKHKGLTEKKFED